MDKDRVKGGMRKAGGAAKDAAGKVTGDRRLQAEGKADKAIGTAQGAFGRLKDRLRGLLR